MTGNLPNGTTQRDLDAAAPESREVCEECWGWLEQTWCQTCRGFGEFATPPLGGGGGIYWAMKAKCVDCNGTGRGELICPRCDGEE